MEQIIPIDPVDPRILYGSNNVVLTKLKGFFPKVKMVARGHELKLIGSTDDIAMVEEKVALMLKHVRRFDVLTVTQLESLVLDEKPSVLKHLYMEDDVILHGVNGKVITARTAHQRDMVNEMANHDLLFATGPAGTGKTYTAVAIAVSALKNRAVSKLVLTRPAVEAGESLGFLPGDMKDKLDPYMQPLYDALRDMIPTERLSQFLERGTIEIAPMAFMRGRTLDNAFVILDEAQNTTVLQMKMFLTRMGRSSKFIITGDTSQVDLPIRQKSGLAHAVSMLKDTEGIAQVVLDGRDVIRHPLVRKIIQAYDSQKPTP